MFSAQLNLPDQAVVSDQKSSDHIRSELQLPRYGQWIFPAHFPRNFIPGRFLRFSLQGSHSVTRQHATRCHSCQNGFMYTVRFYKDVVPS
jgi:hypothetical protein